MSRIAVRLVRDAPLRAILQACYDLHGEGRPPLAEAVMLTGSTIPGSVPWRPACSCRRTRTRLPEDVRPAPWQDRLKGVLATLDRARAAGPAQGPQAGPGRNRPRVADPDAYRALQLEYRRLMTQRPDTKTKTRPDPSFVREGGFWMDKLDEGLKTLLDLGKRRGFLTFDQVNDYLPDEATQPRDASTACSRRSTRWASS